MMDAAAIERWADENFTQGEVAVIMRLVTEYRWLPPTEVKKANKEAWDEGYDAYGSAMAGWIPDDPENPYND